MTAADALYFLADPCNGIEMFSLPAHCMPLERQRDPRNQTMAHSNASRLETAGHPRGWGIEYVCYRHQLIHIDLVEIKLGEDLALEPCPAQNGDDRFPQGAFGNL